MTPLHDGTLEAAAKVAEELIDPEWPNDDLSNQAKDIAGRIRALAIKPTPAGEGEESEVLPAGKTERFHLVPAASPVQGVRPRGGDDAMPDSPAEMTAAEDVLTWLLIEKLRCPDDCTYTPNEAQEIIAAKLDELTATPQAPSTVDEGVKNKKQYSEWTFAERAKFFAEGKIDWEEFFNAPPELNFAPRFRPTIGGKLVRPTGCPEHGYLSVEDALKGGREFQEASRAALDASREK